MNVLVGSILTASLIGSPHCAGMCGGFVVFYAGQASGGRRVAAHCAYNLGRLASYALLGAFAGALGADVERAGAWAGLSGAAAVAAGLLMVGWSVVQILRVRGAGVRLTAAPSRSGGWFAFVLRSLHGQPPVVRALIVGLATTLLPCGWLAMFIAPAAASGSPLGGALVMAVFWAGTLPVMAGLGLLAQRAVGPLRRRLPVVTAAALMVLGILTIAGKMSAPIGPGAGHSMHHGPVAPHPGPVTPASVGPVSEHGRHAAP